MPASFATVSNRTRGRWFVIFRSIRSVFSGRSSGTGSSASVRSCVRFWASSAGVSVLSSSFRVRRVRAGLSAAFEFRSIIARVRLISCIAISEAGSIPYAFSNSASASDKLARVAQLLAVLHVHLARFEADAPHFQLVACVGGVRSSTPVRPAAAHGRDFPLLPRRGPRSRSLSPFRLAASKRRGGRKARRQQDGRQLLRS